MTLGGGAGYDLIDRIGLEWNISAGPAYQKTWFDSVPVGEPTTSAQAALTFGSKFDWDITQRIDLILEYRGQYTSRKVGDTLHHAVGTLSVELTKRLDLNLSLIWDRIQNPMQDSSGTKAQQDDLQLVMGVGVRF